MQNFQPILIAIGILAILGVLIHGFLISKKEQESVLPEEYEDLEEDPTESNEEPYVTMVESDVDAMEFYGIASQEDDEDLESFDISINDDNVIDEDDSNIDEQDMLIDADTLLTDSEVADKDFDEVSTKSNTIGSELEDEVATEEEVLNDPEQMSSIEEPTDIFVFNVVARDGSKLGGHELLQFFLTSGFRYGHMNIFHRHENSDGTGEVLFSIANMMAPGTFDLDSMEQFQSQGISFFLTAPNDKIDIKKAFDLMLRAVVQIADEFHCDVLNEQRGTLTEAQFIEYRSRLLQYT
ncbi:cell division protein ZipA [Psychromonas algicola]|uniref:cell division protein ZipA n=1 Tax=Psychromonas algicola TaxID=2555642 RepID=UPI0010674CED|nr:cell division protein ZipA [Psychromonas sp. RZ5]TEW47849.1 cell division protein ZipA [Psychromonas sp. RZ5]